MLNTYADTNGIRSSTRRFLLVVRQLRVGCRERVDDELSYSAKTYQSATYCLGVSNICEITCE
jgi:hypothetical protein